MKIFELKLKLKFARVLDLYADLCIFVLRNLKTREYKIRCDNSLSSFSFKKKKWIYVKIRSLHAAIDEQDKSEFLHWSSNLPCSIPLRLISVWWIFSSVYCSLSSVQRTWFWRCKYRLKEGAWMRLVCLLTREGCVIAVRVRGCGGSVDERLRRRGRRPVLVGGRGVRVVRRMVAESSRTTQQQAAVTRHGRHIMMVILVHSPEKKNTIVKHQPLHRDNVTTRDRLYHRRDERRK